MFMQFLEKIGHSPTVCTKKDIKYISPFNQEEKTPSFFLISSQNWDRVDPKREYNYKCWSSGKGGNFYNFVMEYYNLDFTGALKKINANN